MVLGVVAAGQAAKEGAEQAQEPPPPAEVEVRFKAPARTVLKVGGRTVKPNDTLSLAPGIVRIDYRCPGRRAPKGRTEFEVPGSSTEPVVYTLDCRQKSRR